MKIYAHRKFHVLLFAFIIAGAALDAGEISKPLPGSETKMQDAATKADVVVVGKITKAGYEIVAGYWQYMFVNTKVQTEKTLKGEVKEGIIFVTVRGLDDPDTVDESVPKPGVAYIFFLKKPKESTEFEVLKIIAANEKSIKDVQAEIAAHSK